MIISHKHRFIFIKTSKTAGTSIEIALSRFCGDSDVITKNFPAEELLKKDLGYHAARNYRIPLYQYRLQDWLAMIKKFAKGEKRISKRYYSHSSAQEIMAIAGMEIWKDYFKFCFERNPWDRAVSFYYFMQEERRRRGKPVEHLSEFIRRDRLGPLKTNGYYNYTIDGEVAVDRVCLYENLEAELEYVCNHILGLPEPLVLPHAKGQHRKDRRHYREILGREERDRVAELFAEEINRFGYSF